MSSSRGKRYDSEPKLNYKKVFGVIVALAVIVMMIVLVVKMIKNPGDTAEVKATNYYAAYTNNKWVVINNKGEIIIDNNNEMIVVPNNEKAVFIVTDNVNEETGEYSSKAVDTSNNQIFTEYSKIESIENSDSKNNIWYENVLKVQKDGKYGLIDLDGKLIANCEYDEITALTGVKGNLKVKKDEKVGLLNANGQTIIDTIYANILPMEENYTNEYIVMNENNQYGVVTTSGKVVVEPQYENVKYINSSDYYAVKDETGWKLYSITGDSYISGEYDNIVEMKGDNIVVVKNSKYGVVNKNNETIIEKDYEYLKYTFSIYYIAKKGDKYGVVNTNNETIINFEYQNMSLVKSGSFIIADKTDTETIVFDSNLAQKITGIISEVNTDKGYIKAYDNNGDYKYYNFKFEEKSNADILSTNKLVLKKENGKYGYADKAGNVVVEPQFDDATEQNSLGYSAVKKDGKWGCIDSTGKMILEPSVNLDNNIYVDFIAEWHLSDDGMFYTK